MPEFTDPGGLTEFTPSSGGFDWSTLAGDPFGAFSGGSPGSSFGLDQFYLDTETGQTYSLAQIQGQNDLAQAFQAQFGIGAPNTNVGDPGFGTQTGQPTSASWLTPQNLALLGIGLPALLGIGGLIQGFSGGGNTATTVNQPTQSPTAQAAQQAALQGFQGAQQFAFGNPQANAMSNQTGQIQPGAGGLASQLQTMAPLQQQAQISAIQGLMNQMQTNPFLAGPVGSAMQPQGQPWMQQGQPGQGGQAFAQPWMQPQAMGSQVPVNGAQRAGVPLGVDPASWAASLPFVEGGPEDPQRPYTGPVWTNPSTGQMIFGGETGPVSRGQSSGAATGGAIDPRSVFQPGISDFGKGLGTPYPFRTPEQMMAARAAQAGTSAATGGMGMGNPILNQLAQQLQGYGGAQGALMGLGGLGALNLQNPAAGALGQQALGMAQGNLPALSPALRAQVGQTFEPYQQDINRQLDQALQNALERSRQQGFAGGTGVFREGTPAALLAPGLAETTRQQGTLSGLRAQAELALAQSLPQQGGNLANQLFQQQLGQNQAVQQAAQGYTTPMSIALGGGLNLSNLNQNIIQALGNFGQQGMGNQLDFLRAISAPLSGLSGLSGSAQAGAGSTMTQNQPFNLLSAFAPTAQLLGGIGGAMTGYGAMTGQYNPYSQYQNPGTVRW